METLNLKKPSTDFKGDAREVGESDIDILLTKLTAEADDDLKIIENKVSKKVKLDDQMTEIKASEEADETEEGETVLTPHSHSDEDIDALGTRMCRLNAVTYYPDDYFADEDNDDNNDEDYIPDQHVIPEDEGDDEEGDDENELIPVSHNSHLQKLKNDEKLVTRSRQFAY